MSVIRLYVDEDACENAVVLGLRARGVDLLTTLDAGRTGTTDSDQLAFAVQQARTIYTFNVGDFAQLHAEYLRQKREHFGIVVIPDQRYSIGEKIKRIARLISTLTAAEMVNRMEFL